MDNQKNSSRYEDLLKRALQKIDQLKGELDTAKQADSVAIIGMSCRFPGASSIEQYWDNLINGVDSISAIPGDRWDVKKFTQGKTRIAASCGGFIDFLREFDAEFFGISPKEAISLDPQQRLTLELCWELFENSGISPELVRDSLTGVFLGLCSNDYRDLLMQGGQESLDAYFSSGNCHSTAVGRVAYFLGLKGPAVAVDTACSSSSVALHLACQALHSGDLSMAICGGVNRIITPEIHINFTKAGMLSSAGRCQSFSDSADGYVRSEGGGMLLLKLLSQAQKDGNEILGIISGSALNQDGSSSGLTVPNGPSQASVIRAAIKKAGIGIDDVSYIEAHGTGTKLGDPIEVESLASVFKSRKLQQKVLLGSAKSQIGHMEAAAGVAGIIKAVLVLQNKTVPPNLHCDLPNTHITWDDVPFQLPTAAVPIKFNGEPIYAGVSSFGFSGTNSHIILRSADDFSKQNVVESSIKTNCLPLVLPISAHSRSALNALIEKYIEKFSKITDIDQAEILCRMAAVGRQHFKERVCVLGHTIEELVSQLHGEIQSPDGPLLLAKSVKSQINSEATSAAIKLAQAYIAGEDVDWQLYCGNQNNKFLKHLYLPNYPFQRKIYWPAFAIKSQTNNCQEWFYRATWPEKRRDSRITAVSVTSGIKDICLAAQSDISNENHTDNSIRDYCAFEDWLEKYTLLSVMAELKKLQNIGEKISEISQLCHSVLPKYSQLIQLLCKKLEEQKYISVVDGVLAISESARAARAACQCADQQWLLRPEYTLTQRCLNAFSQVVTGKQDPIAIIFNAGTGSDEVSKIYSDGAILNYLSKNLSKIIASQAECLDSDSALSILEIGAGTGGTTAHILSQLPKSSAHYCFTDISRAFLEVASKKFSDHGFIDYALLDISVNPHSQGFTQKKFDIIVASNAIHAVKNLGDAIKHIRQLLKPGGVLLLIEGTKSQNWVDVTFGLTDGWWHFTDSVLRDGYPLLSAKKWQSLLLSCGFEATEVIAPFNGSSQQLIVAKMPLEIEKSNNDSYQKYIDKNLFSEIDEYRFAAVSNKSLSFLAKGERQLPVDAHTLLCIVPKPGKLSHASVDVSRRCCFEIQQVIKSALKKSLPVDIVVIALGYGGADVFSGSLRAFIRNINLECPTIYAKWIGVESELTEATVGRLIGEISDRGDDTEVILTCESRKIARLHHWQDDNDGASSVNSNVTIDGKSNSEYICSTTGVYLVTGGLGGMGLLSAKWLAQKSVKHIVLLGRHQLESKVQKSVVQDLRAQGIRVDIEILNLSDYPALENLFTGYRQQGLQLKGIIHAAGVIDPQIDIDKLQEADFDRQYEAKAAGTWNLHALSEKLALEFFICFSSAAASWGFKGHSHYAAANAFMDELMLVRHKQGLRGSAVNWGYLQSGGMTASEEHQKILKDQGVLPIHDEGVTATLDYVVNNNVPQITVTNNDWILFAGLYKQRNRLSILNEVFKSAQQSTSFNNEKLIPANPMVINLIEEPFRIEVLNVTQSKRQAMISRILQKEVAKVMLMIDSLPNVETGFLAMGIDSLMALDLKQSVAQGFGIAMPETMIYDYPTIKDLASSILHRLKLDNPVTQIVSEAYDVNSNFLLKEDDLVALLDREIQELTKTLELEN